MQRTKIAGIAAAFFASTFREFSPSAPQIGPGQERAAARLQAHREKQAARVAPALEALAGKRRAWAYRRSLRWAGSNPDLFIQEDAPGHIWQMAKERE